jgi:eukaryotic-like serine/threonine-protein kinase
MTCSHCGHENPASSRFCAACGTSLTIDCPSCHSANDPEANFCSHCGQPLATGATTPVSTAAAPPPKAVSPPSTPPSVPTSFANGRYQVKRFLGEGGKKKVYLALDTLLDREVAFALIKTEGLDETARVRIRREAQAMGRLGAHPHIVAVFDLGEENGQPYMVTEFMGGGDVEHLLKKADQHRLPIERSLEIAHQVGMGLQFAHGKGIVHRDLKPGNVWLTGDGVAKIGDFGLALSLDRSRLTREGMMVGTVSYMPPEQAMGHEVTPQADLYSLGAMLYEMVTGRPPFLGDDPIAIIGQHINTPPVAPIWHNERCPRDLEALILHLLAKDPAQRPSTVVDVLTALDCIDPKAVAERPEEETHSLDSLAGGVFVGRQREMGELKAALEQALGGRGSLTMLVGEPGIGKTRTALELGTYAGLRKAQVLWGRCYEAQGTPPYWPWVQAIRSWVREHDAAQVRSQMGAGAADIAEIVSDVQERLPDLKPAPALESAESARFRLFDSITAFLKSASKAQPLVLILDDLQWADTLTLLLLQFVAGELADSHILTVGAYRDVELSRKHPLAQTLAELTRERAFRRVPLRGLSQEDVGRFIELTSGIKPPEALVTAVHGQTEGNPLFVNEVVRLLVQEGELSPQRLKERKSWTVRIPEGVREVIGRRLDRMSERCNQVLTVASVIGREFSFEQMARLSDDTSEERLLAMLEEAVAARVIEEMPRPAGRYQFTHALIQETLASELSSARRVRLQARIAQGLEALYGAHADDHAAELAFHFGEAEPVLGSDKLAHYSLVAGEKALAACAYEDAMAHYQRGLAAKEGQPVDEQMAALLFGLGRAEAALVIVRDAARHLAVVFNYHAQAGDVQRAIAAASVTFTNSLGYNLMAPVVERALQLAPTGSVEAGRLLCVHGRHLGEGSDYEGGRAAFLEAIAIAQNAEDRRLQLSALAQWAFVASGWSGRACERAIDEAMPLLDTIDSPWDESLVRMLACVFHVWKGQAADAAAQGKVGLAVAARLRDRMRLAGAHMTLQNLSQSLGDWGESRRLYDEAVASFRHPHLLANRLLLESELGYVAEAEPYLAELLEYLEDPLTPTGPTANSWALLCMARAAGIAGNATWLDIVRIQMRRVLASPRASVPGQHFTRMAMALVAVADRDGGLAAEQYALLDAMYRSDWVVLAPYGSRWLGIIAQAAGFPVKAAGHFEEALAFNRKAGYRPELAWTCCDYADLLRQRNGPGDENKATALLDEGLGIARDLGMKPLLQRILARRKILKA